MLVLILAVHDVQRQIFLPLAAGELLIAEVGVVRVVVGKVQRQVVILKKIHQRVHFLGGQAVQGQVCALVVHQLRTARADPVVGPDAAQQALAHADAPAARGNRDLDAGLLHGADGLGVFLRHTLTAAGPQRAVYIK